MRRRWFALIAAPLVACGQVVEPTVAVPMASVHVLPTATTLIRVYDLRVAAVTVSKPELSQLVPSTPAPDPPDLRALVFQPAPIQLPSPAAVAPLPPAAIPPTPRPAPPPAPTPAPVIAQPTPTVLPSAQTSVENQAYFGRLLPPFALAGAAINNFADLASRLEAQPTLLFDPDWRREMGTTLGVLRGSGLAMQEIPDPPVALVAIDEQVKSMGRDMVYVADELAAGLDGGGVGRINNATARLAVLNQKSNRLSADLRRLGQLQ